LRRHAALVLAVEVALDAVGAFFFLPAPLAGVLSALSSAAALVELALVVVAGAVLAGAFLPPLAFEFKAASSAAGVVVFVADGADEVDACREQSKQRGKPRGQARHPDRNRTRRPQQRPLLTPHAHETIMKAFATQWEQDRDNDVVRYFSFWGSRARVFFIDFPQRRWFS
jgi:hypothetical protein